MPERPRILIVDDDPLDRQAVIRALQGLPAQGNGVEADVREADTIAQAREALRDEEFVCVFLDHNLPDGTSLDLLLEVRAQGLATPVIVLTGERDEQIIAEVMRAGAIDYLPKQKLRPDLVARSLRVALRFLQVQREKEAALAEMRARDRALAAATNGIVIVDPHQPDCPLVYVNEAFLRMTGYAQQEVLGRNCRFLQGPDTDPDAVRELREAVVGGCGCQVPILNYRKDGTTFWNEVTISPVSDARGRLTHFVGVQADTTARHEAEAEHLRSLAEQSARAEREALLNRLGQTIRIATAPQQVLEAAVTELGEALGVDRCYYAAYDQDADRATVGPEWHRAGLPPLTGEYVMSRFAVNRDPVYKAGHTQVVADARDDPAALELGLHALVRVPLVSGASMTALSVAMAGGPRVWTADEATLVEVVATQTQIALEAVRLRLREHRIAEQLQAALQPPLPASVPGLALADYYRPAWEDQGVGGDFSDVFLASGGVTFLVVGDLSGKGLQAASQVATVRHMLRFALLNSPSYGGHTLAGPVTALNRTLADFQLIENFATLFVGRFDARVRALTYVNCGQDAGLILRAATGTVEALPPTGPVLGAFAGAEYGEGTVTLEVDDVLALYTDGLSEAGPTRSALLTGDGVADLLGQQAGVVDPQAVVAGLMAGVDAHAGSGARDDQCLLIGVARGPVLS